MRVSHKFGEKYSRKEVTASAKLSTQGHAQYVWGTARRLVWVEEKKQQVGENELREMRSQITKGFAAHCNFFGLFWEDSLQGSERRTEKSEFCFKKFTLATVLKIKMRLEVRVRIETKRIAESFCNYPGNGPC